MHQLLADYRAMARIRAVEEALMSLKTGGEVPGSIHLCNGQEAIPVGAVRALEPGDLVTATYRGHGWALARGTDPAALLAECMGKDSPLNGGRAASPYLSDPSVGFLGENSIVGAGLPIAAGAALSQQRLRTGKISLVSIGDGALNQGNVSEGLNLAIVLKLPLVVVVENNVYSEMSPIADMVGIARLTERAAGFGIPAEQVDGNDPQVVHDAVARAAERARTGGGPTVVEAMTARLVGHYSGDVQHYRPKGEVEAARAVEPLVRARALLGAAAAAVDDDVRAEVEQAIAAARSMPEPDPASVGEHVHA